MKLLQLSIAVVLFFTLSSFGDTTPASKKGDQFKILVSLKGLPDETKIFLIASREGEPNIPFNHPGDTVATVLLSNGKAAFSGNAGGAGRKYQLAVQGQVRKLPLLISDKEKLSISGDAEKWPNVKVSGSKGTAQMMAYATFIAQILEKQSREELNASILQYIHAHAAEVHTPYLLVKSIGIAKEDKIAAYSKLSTAAKSSYYGLRLKESIASDKLAQAFREGLEMPYFRLKMLEDGQTVSIKELAAKNKYTLIDFWGTWCGPCVAAFPALKELYKEYHPKGFEIIGITKGEQEEPLKKFVKGKELPWLQGIDSFEGLRDNILLLGGVPAYVLLDKDAKVLAFIGSSKAFQQFGPEIYGDGLAKTLKALFP